MDIPEHVRKVVDQLTLDPSVLEVWLIGSQPSDSSTLNSDWDLLVRSTSDPTVRLGVRREGVDVLWCGPSGTVLLEGKPTDFAVDFSDFRWREVSEGRAQYRGRRFTDLSFEPHDSSMPVQKFVDCVGIRVWKKKSA